MRDLDTLMASPAVPNDACEKVSTRVTSISMVRYLSNDYSVPVAFAHHEVQVRRYVGEVVIGCGMEVIAKHRRSYEKADGIRSDAPSAPAGAEGWRPGSGGPLAGLGAARGLRRPPLFAGGADRQDGQAGIRAVRVLGLLETFRMTHVHGAVLQALDLGAMSFDAIKHLVLCRVERRPPRLDLDIYSYLPRARVKTTKPASYMSLMSRAGPRATRRRCCSSTISSSSACQPS